MDKTGFFWEMGEIEGGFLLLKFFNQNMDSVSHCVFLLCLCGSKKIRTKRHKKESTNQVAKGCFNLETISLAFANFSGNKILPDDFLVMVNLMPKEAAFSTAFFCFIL